jgi:hypothetical protein
MIDWILVFLFLHIGAAIIAFGPTFAFPIIGGMGGKEPMFANFATRVSATIERRLVLPFALTLPLSGIGLIWTKGIDILAPTSRWLLIGIAVYVFAIAYVVFVQDPAIHKVIEMTSRPPDTAGGPPPGGPPAGGPPPALMAAVKKVQQGGMILTVALVIIFAMMIIKPLS